MCDIQIFHLFIGHLFIIDPESLLDLQLTDIFGVVVDDSCDSRFIPDNLDISVSGNCQCAAINLRVFLIFNYCVGSNRQVLPDNGIFAIEGYIVLAFCCGSVFLIECISLSYCNIEGLTRRRADRNLCNCNLTLLNFISVLQGCFCCFILLSNCSSRIYTFSELFLIAALAGSSQSIVLDIRSVLSKGHGGANRQILDHPVIRIFFCTRTFSI